MYYSIPLRVAASLFILGWLLVRLWSRSDQPFTNRLLRPSLCSRRETKVENEIRSTRENGGRAKIFEKLLRFFSPFSFLLFVGEIIATRHFATAGSRRPISGDGSRSLETDMQIFMLPKSAAPGLLLSAIFQRSRVTFVPRERFANFSSRWRERRNWKGVSFVESLFLGAKI